MFSSGPREELEILRISLKLLILDYSISELAGSGVVQLDEIFNKKQTEYFIGWKMLKSAGDPTPVNRIARCWYNEGISWHRWAPSIRGIYFQNTHLNCWEYWCNPVRESAQFDRANDGTIQSLSSEGLSWNLELRFQFTAKQSKDAWIIKTRLFFLSLQTLEENLWIS